MKRWATRVGQLLSVNSKPPEKARDLAPFPPEKAKDLAPFFEKIHEPIEKFVESVSQQINDGKITRKALLQVMSKEYNEQARILSNNEFLRVNCRVPAAADGPGRPTSRQGSAEDDPANAFIEDRERCKKDSDDLLRTQEKEQQKKRPKGQ